MTHQPAYMVADYTPYGIDKNVGCHFLRKKVEEIQPRLFVTGHLHSNTGIYQLGKTTVVSACYVGEDYKPNGKSPIIITV